MQALAAKADAHSAGSTNILAAEGRVMQLGKRQPNQGRNDAFPFVYFIVSYAPRP